jgi:curli production assembly/transport component CsgG|tara:strand:+ start:714 stop:1556 length:843 start_codon:yes stop_codon:yes gene_type:complete
MVPKQKLLYQLKDLDFNMHKLITTLLVLVFLTGCSSLNTKVEYELPRGQDNPLQSALDSVPELGGPKITVAVYKFSDYTGQRKAVENGSSLSSAVSQGSEVWVIKALADVGHGTWFQVVERGALDSIIKERQLIRNTRELHGDKDVLDPMLFAGLIIEGGIVGYDTDVLSGGNGARLLGLGVQEEFRMDTITVAMRVISVQTGEVLLSVATEKTIASSRTGASVFKFLDMGTKALEIESGKGFNEPINYATRAAIEQGIIEIIYQGANKGLWGFKGVTNE